MIVQGDKQVLSKKLGKSDVLVRFWCTQSACERGVESKKACK